MLAATKYNLAHLLDFGGRDARQTFWYYVLFLFIVYFVLGIIGSFVLIGSLMAPIIEAAQQGATEQQMQLQMSGWMGGFMGTIMWVSMGVNIVMDLLLAAAFVRRLHDSNSSGWWGLLILAAQAASMVMMIPLMNSMQDVMSQAMDPANIADPVRMQAMMANQSRFGLYGLVGWIGPLAAVVFGVLPSTDGPNRYGEAPVRF